MKPYEDQRTKKEQVEAMFDNIAPAYDRLNDIMSFGVARVWRRAAVRRVRQSGARGILDLATGTGDLAVAMARKIPGAHITGADLSEGMLALAREKAARAGVLAEQTAAIGAPEENTAARAEPIQRAAADERGIGCFEPARGSSPHEYGETGAEPSRSSFPNERRKSGCVDFCKAEAERLPFADGAFDAVTAAFGVRNFADIPQGLREMRRVLRPGGRVFILEFSTPRGKIFGALYRFYFHRVLPRIGGGLSKDRAAYGYLPGSVDEFPAPERFLQMMETAGFTACRAERFTGGITYIYSGMR